MKPLLKLTGLQPKLNIESPKTKVNLEKHQLCAAKISKTLNFYQNKVKSKHLATRYTTTGKNFINLTHSAASINSSWETLQIKLKNVIEPVVHGVAMHGIPS